MKNRERGLKVGRGGGQDLGQVAGKVSKDGIDSSFSSFYWLVTVFFIYIVQY